jgi:hypothetical protein
VIATILPVRSGWAGFAFLDYGVAGMDYAEMYTRMYEKQDIPENLPFFYRKMNKNTKQNKGVIC